jgi:hypothetical protein
MCVGLFGWLGLIAYSYYTPELFGRMKVDEQRTSV